MPFMWKLVCEMASKCLLASEALLSQGQWSKEKLQVVINSNVCVTSFLLLCISIGHVKEYPTMHCFEIPRHTQSMIAFKILTEVISEFKLNNAF